MASEIIDMFPYPNEHSARLQDPNMSHIRIRRTSGSGDGTVQGVKIPTTIDIIWYITKKDGKEVPIAQALRFPTKSWTEAEARKWLKDNKIKYISFEPAAETKEKQVISSEADFDNLAGNPFVFNMPGAVEFAADGDGPKNRVRLTLYDGSVVKHHYWGNLAFELSTMRMAKKRNPILFTHDVGQRIAVSDKTEFEPRFIMEGDFLKSSKIGQEIKEQMMEGFPFEASLRFDPEKSKIEFVKDDEIVEVNGNKLKGPGTVIKNAHILEGSICVFSALRPTQSEAFEIIKNLLIEKENIMNEQNTVELTLDAFAEQYPELHSHLVEKAKGDGGKSVRELFSKFVEKFGDDPSFCIEQFGKGASLGEATEARVEKLKIEKQQLSEQVESQVKTKLGPAAQEFSDQQSAIGKTDGSPPPEKPKDKYAREFNASKEIQDEFGGPEGLNDYIAYREALDAGKIEGRKDRT